MIVKPTYYDTGFPKQASSVGEVPEWAINMVPKFVGAESLHHQGSLDAYTTLRTAFARYIAAHEPEPVDPLREALVEAEKVAASGDNRTDDDYWDNFAKALRQRGVTATQGEG